jgi:hypothetical protein
MDKFFNGEFGMGWRQGHVADHLWVVEIRSVGAAFEARDDEGWVVSCDSKMFRNTAEAVRAYREGYSPNVTYP